MQLQPDVGDRGARHEGLLILDGDQPRPVEHRGLVLGADGGPAALEALARKTFNMVVSDLRMSPMDGLTLLGEIRHRYPGLPVLLMTAFGDVDKAVAAMRGGACDFMLKPFEPKALLDQIARYATPPRAEGVSSCARSTARSSKK